MLLGSVSFSVMQPVDSDSNYCTEVLFVYSYDNLIPRSLL